MFPGMFLKCGTWYCTSEVLECSLAESWPVQAGICLNCSQVGFEAGDHSQEVVLMQSPRFRELRGFQSQRGLFCVSCPQCLDTFLCTFHVLVPVSFAWSENLPKPLPLLPFMSPLLLRERECVTGGCLYGVYLNYAPASVIVADSVSVISFDQSQVLI